VNFRKRCGTFGSFRVRSVARPERDLLGALRSEAEGLLSNSVQPEVVVMGWG
jgi:hypothetical protein